MLTVHVKRGSLRGDHPGHCRCEAHPGKCVHAHESQTIQALNESKQQRGVLARPQLQRAPLVRQCAGAAALLQHLRCTGALRGRQALPAERQAPACVCYASQPPGQEVARDELLVEPMLLRNMGLARRAHAWNS